MLKIAATFLLGVIAGAGIGYFTGYSIGVEDRTGTNISSFAACAAAGYPVAESYPRQCRTPDGRNFVEDVTDGVACTMDAKLCPDGSSVGRTGPNCEFAPCPGEITR
ncbi:TPA: hypothetical protein DIV55_03825 [Patescibacteria group bacterium]|uniref:Uncharacterized protein n=1 Tax=Candidatus Gottesmanbacteria bacterium GW2011_GWA1_43_11 TaxID=1618436 RepID=A0A0G1CJ12_9BACT|nr:MAG: hypothetical protein UV59_C0007G0065 [Candidatus Gottesmanbacteria bacterium GW2011_GWA1_43_11]HCS78848.1 hypothetical protein [Patescibacteria group bacterium]